MPRVPLLKIAHGRSGDKGNLTNIGIIARHPDIYPFLIEQLTSSRVKEYMKHVCKGEVERYRMDNIEALNFVLHQSLDGGGTISLNADAQGKTYAMQLLRLELEVPKELLAKAEN